MKRFFPSIPIFTALCPALLAALGMAPCFAAATLAQRIDPPEVNLGSRAVLTLTVQGGTVMMKKDASTIFGMALSSVDIPLPPVDGLLRGRASTRFMSFNGESQTTASFTLIPARAGDFTIPAFDIHTQEGEVLHVKAMKLHVLDTGNSARTADLTPAIPAPPAVAVAPAHPGGPVVMPPANAAGAAPPANDGNSADATSPGVHAPRDNDGSLAKVFIIITALTTNTYVGQSVPLEIDFYIRLDVNWEQNSLPTIKGSDFLMNNFTTRGRVSGGTLEDKQYMRETWVTAISAPKSGDFPLSMVRDTYWIKSITTNNLDPFGGYFSRHANLAHEPIPSNQLTIHVHALPIDGQPANFTGAIGDFRVTGEAQPGSVAIGEPVTLRFTVSGEGNFDYVRCPTLPDDPAWKTYVPRSAINYLNDESRTHALKTFAQAAIPKRNGNVPLPPASFSYFNPTAKQYITVPIALPEITVTGSSQPLAATAPEDGNDSVAAMAEPKAAGFLPNRLEIGSPRLSFVPVYRRPWFWALQGGLLTLPLLGALVLLLHSPRSVRDDGRAERESRRRSRRQEEDAMADAVRRGDAPAFFVAARHAVQLQLGERWTVRPEAITLGEIRGRDAALAGTLAPLFLQADEVIYSGCASPGLDLAQWEQRVRTEFLEPQPA